MTVSLGNGGEYGKFGIQLLSKVHDGGDVAAAVAVVGSTPDGDDGFVFKVPLYAALALAEPIQNRSLAYLIAFINELMSTGNKLEAVDVVELCSDLVAEQPSSTTWRYSPSSNVLRVAPDQIAEGAFVRDLLSSSNDAYLVKRADLRT